MGIGLCSHVEEGWSGRSVRPSAEKKDGVDATESSVIRGTLVRSLGRAIRSYVAKTLQSIRHSDKSLQSKSNPKTLNPAHHVHINPTPGGRVWRRCKWPQPLTPRERH